MKLAVLTCGMLPIPAVQGGAVENLIDFYLEYNNIHQLHDITVYSPWDSKVKNHSALSSKVNHYVFIDVTSFKARIARRFFKFFHTNEHYNYFIEFYFEKVYADIRKKDYDYILLENCPGFVYKLSLRDYKKIIMHLHNDGLNNHSKHHDVIIKNLTKTITVSDYIRSRVATLQPAPKKIQTVHNGIDLKNFAQKGHSLINRKKIGFSEEDFIIVYSGRINKEKGVSELIEAMLILKDQPQIKLMIIGGTFFGNTTGDDDFIKKLKEKALPLKENIVFTGFIPYELIPQYLNIADIAVIPSIWNDPFPTTVLEAQAMGLPIIATNRGGIPEEVTEANAILLDIDERFVINLAQAILDLYKHPEKREQMATASLKHSKQFDRNNYAKNFFAALEGL